MKHVGGVAAVAAGVMLLAGCGASGNSPAASTTTVTTTETETATSSPESAATTAAEVVADEVKYGELIEADVANFTVSDVRDVTNPQDQLDDGTWAAMIEICATGNLGGPISPMSMFVLLDSDGGTYQPNGSTGGMMPTPQLDPGMLSVPEGGCRKGNLFFDAPPEANITSVEVIDGYGTSRGTWSS